MTGGNADSVILYTSKFCYQLHPTNSIFTAGESTVTQEMIANSKRTHASMATSENVFRLDFSQHLSHKRTSKQNQGDSGQSFSCRVWVCITQATSTVSGHWASFPFLILFEILWSVEKKYLNIWSIFRIFFSDQSFDLWRLDFTVNSWS